VKILIERVNGLKNCFGKSLFTQADEELDLLLGTQN